MEINFNQKESENTKHTLRETIAEHLNPVEGWQFVIPTDRHSNIDPDVLPHLVIGGGTEKNPITEKSWSDNDNTRVGGAQKYYGVKDSSEPGSTNPKVESSSELSAMAPKPEPNIDPETKKMAEAIKKYIHDTHGWIF